MIASIAALAHPPPPDAPLMRVDSVCKSYRNGLAETVVLRDLTLEIHPGETTSLVGDSGSGKTTLLSVLAGLLQPDSGTLTFAGDSYDALGDEGLARLRAERIGVVLQGGNLFPFLTALENVELPMKLAGTRRTAGRARGLLAQVGLERRRDHRPGRLSGGEAQRVALAMALANDPDLLLADEVTAELDSVTADSVMNLLLTASRERNLAVLFVTHSSALAARAHQLLHLRDGQAGVG